MEGFVCAMVADVPNELLMNIEPYSTTSNSLLKSCSPANRDRRTAAKCGDLGDALRAIELGNDRLCHFVEFENTLRAQQDGAPCFVCAELNAWSEPWF